MMNQPSANEGVASVPKKKRRRRRRRRGRQVTGDGPSEASPPVVPPAAAVSPDAITIELPARDLEVLDWVCEVLGKDRATICYEIVRREVIRERPGFREARGFNPGTTRKPQPTS